jgi:ribonucleases P/MRP protein subunit RPP40
MTERVRHWATRLVPGFSKLPYEERLERMNLTTLKQRRLRGDMIEVYKYINKKYNVNDLELLPRSTAVGMETRGNSMKLKKRNCNRQRRANFVGFRVVNAWNQLPENVTASTSVNCSKGRYDRWLAL